MTKASQRVSYLLYIKVDPVYSVTLKIAFVNTETMYPFNFGFCRFGDCFADVVNRMHSQLIKICCFAPVWFFRYLGCALNSTERARNAMGNFHKS